MRKFYGLALCAGLASVLAVVYTLLHLDWGTTPGPQPPPAAAPSAQDPAPKAPGAVPPAPDPPARGAAAPGGTPVPR